jgi:pimeloyl-ACP methyl ester carboxylesterase
MQGTLDVKARLALGPAVVREMTCLAAAAALYPFGFSAATSEGLLRALASTATPDRVVGPPVVLVHGYGGNRSAWFPLMSRLVAAGLTDVHTVLYNPLTMGLPAIAERLVADCARAMQGTGTDRVHVVGHSLGGVVLRYAVARLGLGAHLDTGVTVATPHRGVPLARLGHGTLAADLRPGSALLADLASPCPAGTRWICYWSDGDLLVPPELARMSDDVPAVVDVAVPGEGHVSMLRSPAFLADVVERLLAADDQRPGELPRRPPSPVPALGQPVLAPAA